MDDQQFKELSKKLDLLVKLTALNAIKDKDPEEGIQLLSKLGFQPKEIALLLGKTPNYIRVTLHKLRTEKPKFKKKRVLGDISGKS